MSDDENEMARGLEIALKDKKRLANVAALMPAKGDQAALPLFGDQPEMVVIDGDGEDALRSAGRPIGAKNKRAQDIADWILSQVGSPLLVLGKTYSRPVAALAAELECTLAEAFKLQLDAAKALAPYVHQKLPQAIEIAEETALPGLVIGISKAYSDDPDSNVIEMPEIELIEQK